MGEVAQSVAQLSVDGTVVELEVVRVGGVVLEDDENFGICSGVGGPKSWKVDVLCEAEAETSHSERELELGEGEVEGSAVEVTLKWP